MEERKRGGEAERGPGRHTENYSLTDVFVEPFLFNCVRVCVGEGDKGKTAKKTLEIMNIHEQTVCIMYMRVDDPTYKYVRTCMLCVCMN